MQAMSWEERKSLEMQKEAADHNNLDKAGALPSRLAARVCRRGVS